MTISASHFILYVADQKKSTEFYSRALAVEPRLNVPGMTEFEIADSVVVGLMPYSSVARLFPDSRSKPENMSLNAELYLLVDEPEIYHRRALAAGAIERSSLAQRDWGHAVAYSVDPDGNVLAFARAITERS